MSLQNYLKFAQVIPKLRISGVISDKSYLKFQKDLQKIKFYHRPQALAVVVNSPGGSAAKSSLMRQRIRHIGAFFNIPVLTFCEQLAASGGYYVMIGGDTLYAQPGSLIGSIGAMLPSIKLNQLFQKYGVERRGFYSSSNSLYEALDQLSEVKPDQKKMLQQLTNETHQLFIKDVKESRQGKLVGKGELLENSGVVLATEALQAGLIDHLGDVDEVLKERFPGVRVVELSVENEMEKLKAYLGL